MKKITMIIPCVVIAGLMACNPKPAEPKNNTVPPVVETPYISPTTIPTPTAEVETTTEVDIITEAPYVNKLSYKAIEHFARALETENYEAINTVLLMPTNSVITVEDLSYQFKRSSFSEFINNGTIEITNFNDNSGKANADLTINGQSITVYTTLADDDNWYIEYSDFYEKDVTILAPKDCDIIFNGVELDEQFQPKEVSMGRVVYTLTIPKRILKATVETEFGTFEVEVTPTTDEDTKLAKYTICPSITDADFIAEALTAVKDNFNALFQLYDAQDLTISEWAKYFVEDISPTDIQDIQAAIKGMCTWNNTVNNLKIADIELADNYDIVITGDNSIAIYAKTRYTWDKPYSKNDDSKVFTFVILEKEDTKFYISTDYNITNNFTNATTNSMVNKW